MLTYLTIICVIVLTAETKAQKSHKKTHCLMDEIVALEGTVLCYAKNRMKDVGDDNLQYV